MSSMGTTAPHRVPTNGLIENNEIKNNQHNTQRYQKYTHLSSKVTTPNTGGGFTPALAPPHLATGGGYLLVPSTGVQTKGVLPQQRQHQQQLLLQQQQQQQRILSNNQIKTYKSQQDIDLQKKNQQKCIQTEGNDENKSPKNTKINIQVGTIIEDTTCKSINGHVKRYSVGPQLGKGGFAKCYVQTSYDTKNVYAGKIMSLESIRSSNAKKKIRNEIRIHREQHHPNIVKLERYFIDNNNIIILMELCTQNTQMELVRNRRYLSETETQTLQWQLIDVVSYLHHNLVIHRDLKQGNLFLDSNQSIKVGDFGLATQQQENTERKKTICGTPNYIAPEILRSGGNDSDNTIGHSFEVDIWAIGVIAYTLLYGKPPFETNSVKTTYQRIKNNQYEFPSTPYVSSNAKDFIRLILHPNPDCRPSLNSQRKHPFFSQSPFPKVLGTRCQKLPFPFQHWCHPTSEITEPNFEPQDILYKELTEDNIEGEHEIYCDLLKDIPEPKIPDDTTRTIPTDAVPLQTKVSPSTVSTTTTTSSSNTTIEKIKVLQEQQHLNISKNTEKTLKAPELWVSQWVDMSSKYGVGYQLSDGSQGVQFNDNSQIVQNSNGKNVQYIENIDDLCTCGNHPKYFRQHFLFDECPERIMKKASLFQQYTKHLQLNNTLGSPYPGQYPYEQYNPYDEEAIPIYLKDFTCSKQAIIFHLSNCITQIYFSDSTEILISTDTEILSYTNKQQQKSVYTQEQVWKEVNQPEQQKRVRYTTRIQQNYYENIAKYHQEQVHKYLQQCRGNTAVESSSTAIVTTPSQQQSTIKNKSTSAATTSAMMVMAERIKNLRLRT